MLETLGVPVVGFGTDVFPAFYLRSTEPALPVDTRFDDIPELGAYAARELARTCRGIMVANPIPEADELSRSDWQHWLAQAERDAKEAGISGRAWTPYILGRVHALSNGATLRANIALVKSNARVAARLARAMAG
jgi:pseudouridine-5'-phosphate glycosidase